MAAEYLTDLKKLLVNYYEQMNKIKNEIADIPEDEKSYKDYDVAWEISYVKDNLIRLVGREMVRQELGVESKIDQPEVVRARDRLFDFVFEHKDEISKEDIEACWPKPDEKIEEQVAVGEVETKMLHLVSEATVITGESEGNKFPFLIVQAGLSKNRKLYTAEALKAGADLFNNVPIYLDHPDGVHDGRPQPRKFETKVGWWSDAHFADANSKHPAGIVATANIMSNSAHPWLPGMIQEAVESGKPDLVGVSIFVDIEAQPVRDETHGVIYKVLRLTNARSADLVAEPAAGGKALVAAESIMEVDPQMGEKKEEDSAVLTDDQLRELLRSDRVKNFLGMAETIEPPKPDEKKKEDEKKPEDEKITVFESFMERIAAGTKTIEEREQRLLAAESRAKLRESLTAAKLPSGVVEIAMAAEDEGIVLTNEQIEARVKRYKDVAAESSNDAIRRLPPAQREILISYGDSKVTSPIDRVMNSLDIFFGNEVAEDVKANTPRISSIRQFYGQVTGDWAVDGSYHPEESLLGDLLEMNAAEALPTQAKFIGGGTITMGNLFGTSMNRRLLGVYRGQTRWWEPIAVQGPLSNFKQQDRIRTNHYGALTNRPIGTEEYTELEWGETVESYTPSGWGNIVSVNRRAIINDDLNGIRRQPVLLARAANITINEYVAALLTTNSGAGVTMSDTNTAFHATRNNIWSLPLTYDNLRTVRRGGMNITDDAGNKLMNLYRYLLVPVELEDTGYVIQNSTGIPGSINNDPNILANRDRGIWNVITVPNFDELGDWYVSVDAEESLMVPIEVGFINDRREPELFIQDNPTQGMVFTHDGLYYKVRFEFGADIIDAIAMAASLP